MIGMSASGLYSLFPEPGEYLLNGQPLGMPVRDFLTLNYDAFTQIEIAKLHSLEVGESLRGGRPGASWEVKRIA